MTDAGRHLSATILMQHLEDGVAMTYPIPGAPSVRLHLDGSLPRLALRLEAPDAPLVPSNPLKNVVVAPVHAEGHHYLQVTLTGRDLMLDGHRMLSAIADRVQLDGLSPEEATAETLERWREVLAARSRMSVEAEVGLYGELLVLEALSEDAGKAAIEAWRGGDDEEHDFGLAALDLEVKTTSTERREHWISGLMQLQPTGDRPLILLSLQITRGGQSGRTLPQLIVDLGLDPAVLREKAAWSADDADLFPDRWRLRSTPLAFQVDEQFPAVTRALLEASPRDLTPVRDLTYRLDLTHLSTITSNDFDLQGILQKLGNQVHT